MGHARRCAPWKDEKICVAFRSVGSSVARDQMWLRSRSRIATRACCGRYSPRVRAIEQHRFPPASPKLVEGRRAENGYYQPKIAQAVFNDDGEPVRPALSKPELRRGPRGHTSDEVESARIPSGPRVSQSHPSKRPDIFEQPILSIKRQPCAEAGSIYVSTSTCSAASARRVRSSSGGGMTTTSCARTRVLVH
jgi:hypothetical protein